MSAFHILVVDDEEAMRESLAAWLQKAGHEVTMAAGGDGALEVLGQQPCDLALVDVKMPGMDGHELLRRIKEDHPRVMVVMITAYGSIESAVEAMKQGANDYLLKPFDPEHLMLLIEKLVKQKEVMDEYHVMQARLAEWDTGGFEDLLGRSLPMREVFKQIEEVAQTDTPVLISGETGTGKELVARAVHSRSLRTYGPFIAVNCGAIPEHLLESELFGHERGAFTGAVKTRLGRLEMANQGTLFLDEVGEIGLAMQVNLLRALEEKRFLRLGGQREVESDFRLICATHRNLDLLMEEGRIRSDFYYRINVITIRVPPLRERRDDVPLLAHHFLHQFAREMGRRVDGIAPEALRLLQDYAWPGNVRELKNVIERAVVVNRSGTVEGDDLTFLRAGETARSGAGSLEEVEAGHIRKTLETCGWNISRAARILGIHRGTLTRRMKKYGLDKGS
ncbi:MAG: sigma-54 dependent transcriptional regulator [Deltaproteobacteria bacterium]|nr:sigma-54 dependent transcriptional regulator [Deltaproteobacteria bacterium]